MCTYFVNRGDDLIIGMNFDNNGQNFKFGKVKKLDIFIKNKNNYCK